MLWSIDSCQKGIHRPVIGLIDHRLRSNFSHHQKNCVLWFPLNRQVCFHSVNTTSNDLLYADVKNITLGVFIVFINF